MKKPYVITGICIIVAVIVLVLFFNKETNVLTRYMKRYNVTTPVPVVSKPISYGQVTNVQLGQTLTFADFSLKLTTVEGDSRCPANANCIWAGTTTVRTEFVDSKGTTTKIIELGKTSTFGSFTVALTEVAPQSITTHTIIDSEYRFTLDVQKKTSATVPPPIVEKCYVGGCSSEICSAEPDVASNCIYKEEFMCYKTATCERQSNGQCGWTQTNTLKMCLQDAVKVSL